MKYRFRAECIYDACQYVNRVNEITRCVITKTGDLPDVDVTITTKYSLKILVDIANAQTDAHVIAETLARHNEYTGNRIRKDPK